MKTLSQPSVFNARTALSTILLLLTILCWNMTMKQLASSLADVRDTEVSLGVIIDVQIEGSAVYRRNRKLTSKPVIRYSTANGQHIEQAFDRRRFTSIWDKGNTIQVRYKTQQPEQAVVQEFSTLWAEGVASLLFAIGLTLLCIRRFWQEPAQSSRQVKENKSLCLIAGVLLLLAGFLVMML
ncbi:DUF3592 domain-containing protein [Alkalimonas sp. NCh-2]|uniref:DUF3592 domain-containing protein n=1 Tax=Alkalimonas sp. NCh-2 TaxID=3144846 RepID=UPI0031F62019